MAIDGSTGVLTVTLKDVHDRARWSIELEPKLDRTVRVLPPPHAL
jgi:hypothetical protein